MVGGVMGVGVGSGVQVVAKMGMLQSRSLKVVKKGVAASPVAILIT